VVALATFAVILNMKKTDGDYKDVKDPKDSKDKVVKDGGTGTNPSDVFLPEGCKNIGDDISVLRGKKYYKHIYYALDDGTKIPFTSPFGWVVICQVKMSGTKRPVFTNLIKERGLLTTKCPSRKTTERNLA